MFSRYKRLLNAELMEVVRLIIAVFHAISNVFIKILSDLFSSLFLVEIVKKISCVDTIPIFKFDVKIRLINYPTKS